MMHSIRAVLCCGLWAYLFGHTSNQAHQLLHDHTSCSCRAAAALSLLWVLPGALALRILSVPDVLLPLWHPKRQTLHDLVGRTQVVRLR